MKKQTWIISFIFILAIHLTAIVLNSRSVEYISKPLLVILLVLYFLSYTGKSNSGLKRPILAALLFSWLGDVLLMFQQNDPLFFLLGLATFLIAHIFYIYFFNYVRVIENVPRNIWLLLIMGIYFAIMISLLSPYLGNMKWPVRVYAIVISFMCMLAMHMPFIKNKIAGKWMMAGALLFVISDSVLAVNKFFHSFEAAAMATMFTYGLAQLFIVEGAIKYIRSIDTE